MNLPRWLRPPVFADEGKTHEAFLLHVILWALVLVPFPYVLGVALKTPALTERAIVQGLSGEAANVVLLLLLRAGYVRIASILQVCALFAFMTASASTGAGVDGQPYEMGYPLVIVVAGVLLGVRGAVITTIAALGVGLLLLSRDPSLHPETPPGIWIVSAVIFPVIATIQYLSQRTVRRALARATVTLEAMHQAERERKRAEHERNILVQRLAQAHRLESIGRLAAGVAHDFNNLLMCVMNNASFVKRKLPPGDPSLNLLEEVVQAGERAGRLTRQLLAVGSQEEAQPARLDPNRVIEGIAPMLGRMMGERVRLEMVLGSDLPAVFIDPGQLERILINLCVNARDATPPGGRIEIRTDVAHLTEEQSPAVPAGFAGDFVRIAVSDTGVGMSHDVLDRIFEPFFTTKEPGKGTGLGLASVYGIVTQNLGFVTVESEVGVGSRFFAYLPPAPS